MALGFAVSALAIYFLLQQVSIDQLRQVLAHAQAGPIIILVAAVLLSLVTRAARWQVYFLPQTRVPFGPLLETLAISYMASTFLPLRAGELVRAVFLAGRAAVTVPRVVGTIVLEKLFDFLGVAVMLVMLVLIGLWTGVSLPGPALVAATLIALFILVGFGLVVALALWRERALFVLGLVDARMPRMVTERVRLEHVARQFAEGTDSLRVPSLWPPMLGWTFVTWILSLISVWAGAVSLGAEPSLAAILFVSVLTSTGQAVPSSPGYVGVYHAAATLAWTLFGMDAPTAIAVAVITHAFSYGCLVIAGLIALWTGGYTFGDVISGVSGGKTATSPSVALAPES